MRRRTVHTAFAAIAAGCALMVTYESLQLRQAGRVNHSIAHATASNADASVPEAQLARAIALARAGDPDAALKTYKTLIQGPRADLRETALYNVGNLHMRQALTNESNDPTQSLPLIELAKQSYRDALRGAPAAWDARFNLERALRLAPELEDAPVNDDQADAPEEHVSSTLRGARMDLP